MAQLHWFGDRFTINQSLVAQTQICYPNLGKRKFDKHNRPELKKGPALRQKQLGFFCDACTWRNIYGGIRSILLEFWDTLNYLGYYCGIFCQTPGQGQGQQKIQMLNKRIITNISICILYYCKKKGCFVK